MTWPASTRLGLTVAAAVAVAVVTVLATAEDGRLSWGSVAVVLVVGLVGIAVSGLATRRWGRAQLAELQRGYTTTTFRMGGFWLARPPDAPWTLKGGYELWTGYQWSGYFRPVSGPRLHPGVPD